MSCKCLLTPIFMADYWPVKLFYLSEKWIQWIFQRNCSENTPKNSNGSNVMDFIWNCKDYFIYFLWNFMYIVLKLYFFFYVFTLLSLQVSRQVGLRWRTVKIIETFFVHSRIFLKFCTKLVPYGSFFINVLCSTWILYIVCKWWM